MNVLDLTQRRILLDMLSRVSDLDTVTAYHLLLDHVPDKIKGQLSLDGTRALVLQGIVTACDEWEPPRDSTADHPLCVLLYNASTLAGEDTAVGQQLNSFLASVPACQGLIGPPAPPGEERTDRALPMVLGTRQYQAIFAAVLAAASALDAFLSLVLRGHVAYWVSEGHAADPKWQEWVVGGAVLFGSILVAAAVIRRWSVAWLATIGGGVALAHAIFVPLAAVENVRTLASDDVGALRLILLNGMLNAAAVVGALWLLRARLAFASTSPIWAFLRVRQSAGSLIGLQRYLLLGAVAFCTALVLLMAGDVLLGTGGMGWWAVEPRGADPIRRWLLGAVLCLGPGIAAGLFRRGPNRLSRTLGLIGGCLVSLVFFLFIQQLLPAVLSVQEKPWPVATGLVVCIFIGLGAMGGIGLLDWRDQLADESSPAAPPAPPTPKP